MELRQLTTFVTVVQEGTFSAAARALNYSQAAVTLHIQQLERELGARLFDRIGKSVRITPAGRRTHARARQILEAAEEMRRDAVAIEAGHAGQVALGCIEPTATVRLPRRARAAVDGVSADRGPRRGGRDDVNRPSASPRVTWISGLRRARRPSSR